MTDALGNNATVVLLDLAGGPVAAVAPVLKTLGVRVVLVPEFEAALEFVRACPRLALAIVNRALGPDADGSLTRVLRAGDTTLPVIHVGCTGNHEGGRYSLVPHSSSPTALVELIERTLRRRYYPDELIETLTACAIAALVGFDSNVTAAAPALRRSGAAAAQVESAIRLSGEVTGWLLVGGSERHLRRIYRRMFPDSNGVTHADLVDLLGEIGNRTMGGVKNELRSMGVECTLGVPSAPCDPAPDCVVPVLALTLRVRAERVAMEFCLERGDVIASSIEGAQTLLDSGRIIVL